MSSEHTGTLALSSHLVQYANIGTSYNICGDVGFANRPALCTRLVNWGIFFFAIQGKNNVDGDILGK